MKPEPRYGDTPEAPFSNASRRSALRVGITALAIGSGPPGVATPPPARPQRGILEYIKTTWGALTRTHANLALAAADPKHAPAADNRWPVYVPPIEDFGEIERRLRMAMQPDDFAKIDLRVLPADAAAITEHGLLYLPRPWVVPGGRFNEMYGWDSFFIQMGLLRDGELELSRDLAENFLYEIRCYGKVLNANRTYYLSRSQPPFLTGMLLALFRRTQDRQWLEASIPEIENYYQYWVSQPHITPETGLSRYYDSGEGPAPEVVSSELDARGRTDYDLVRIYYRRHRVRDYDESRFYDAATNQLTAQFYVGDRSMRESGFDPSGRFGPFGADIVHYDPICLNSLLYLMESQTGDILDLTGRSKEAEAWRQRAGRRRSKINHLMWDPTRGLYFDYNVVERRTRNYPFLTTFYPLWTGIASPEQAAQVVANLPLFERSGGLLTSTSTTGDQWDAPFGWAPLQWIAVQGLRRYGYKTEADRVSLRFLSLVELEYRKRNAIAEKYDVVHRSDTDSGLKFGYHTNELGFGWTNAVFTALYDGLSPGQQRKLLPPNR